MCVWAVALVSSVRPQAWFTLLALDSLDSLVHRPCTGFHVQLILSMRALSLGDTVADII